MRRLGAIIGHLSDKRSRSLVTVVFCFVGFGVIEFLSHEVLARTRLSPFGNAVLDAAIVGFSFSIAIWFLLAGNRERRNRVREELERIAELNHEVRNALEVIVHSHYLDTDSQHREMVFESVKRIDKVVKRVSRIVGAPQPPTARHESCDSQRTTRD